MGLNNGIHAITSGGLLMSAVFLAITAILFQSAACKVKESPDYDCKDQLNEINKQLTIAYVLIWIAAGLTLLLAIAYGGHESIWTLPEWIHGIIYVVVVAFVVLAVIYAYSALDKLNTPENDDSKNNSDAYIWAGMVLAVLSFLGLIATGSGRVGYNLSGSTTNRVLDAERKINETHAHVTGKHMGITSPTMSPNMKTPSINNSMGGVSMTNTFA